MTNNNNISLTKFQEQINLIHEAFKDLMPGQQNEAIALIQGLYSRSLTFVLNRCNINADDLKLSHHQDAISSKMTIADESEMEIAYEKLPDFDDQNPSTYHPKSSLHLLEKKIVSSNYEGTSVLFKHADGDVNLTYVLDVDKCPETCEDAIFAVKSDSMGTNCNMTLLNSDKESMPVETSTTVKLSIPSAEVPVSSLLFDIDCSSESEPSLHIERNLRLESDCIDDSGDTTLSESQGNALEESETSTQNMSQSVYSSLSLLSEVQPKNETVTWSLEDDSMSCWFCRKQFSTFNSFKQNHSCWASVRYKNNFESLTSNYECLLCESTFSNFKLLLRHLAVHRKLICSICDLHFARQKQLSKHKKSVHGIADQKKYYKCQFCDKQFYKKSMLHIHLRKHANGKIVCIKCGEMFPSELLYSEHMKHHTYSSDFLCKSCNQSFSRKQQYEQHMTAHERHVCSTCDISFSTKKLWAKHQHTVHGIQTNEKKHKCNICKKVFQRPMHLRLHLRIHTGEQPMLCFQCKKSFRSKRALTKHQKTASHIKKIGKEPENQVEKPYLCDECGVRFYQQQSLFRHIEVVHSSADHLKCPHCDYQTKSKANLKRHVDIHTEAKRFVCEICGSSFHAMATLNEHHAYVHSEQRSFVCNLCPKSFKGNSALKRHMRNHSEDRPFKCHCNQAYKRMSHLKRHMSTVHHMVFDSKKLKKVQSLSLLEIGTATKDSSDGNDSTNASAPDISGAKPTDLSIFFESDNNFSLNEHNEMSITNASDYDKILSPAASQSSDFVVPSVKLECLSHANIQGISEENHNGNIKKSSLLSLLESQANEEISETTIDSNSHLSNTLQVNNINILQPAYQTISIPASASNMAAVRNTSSDISHLLPPSSLVTQSSSDSVIVSTENEFIQSLPTTHHLDTKPPLITFSQTSNCNNFKTISPKILIPQFAMNVDLPSHHELHSTSSKGSPKQLFDITSAFVNLPTYTTSLDLQSSAKDQTSLSLNPHDTSLVWISMEQKLKTSDTLSKVSPVLSVSSNTISTPFTNSSFNIHNSEDVFSTSIMFPSDPENSQEVEEFDPLFSQAYAEDVKQILSMS